VCGKYDKTCLEVFDKILAIPTTTTALNIAQLRVSQGGLGLRSTTDHSTAAYLAARSSAVKMSKAMNPSITWLNPEEEITAFNNLVTTDDQIQDIDNPIKQFILSNKIDKQKFLHINNNCDMRTKALLNSTSGKWAGAWVMTPPITALGLGLSPQEWAIAAAYRLGLPINKEKEWCSQCAGKMDSFGDHALNCCKNGHWIRRHHAILKQLMRDCQSAGLQPQWEKAGILGDVDGTACRPADILLPDWSRGKDACLDIAITNPLQAKYINNTAKQGGSAAAHYAEKVKKKKYASKVEAAGKVFIPVIVEATGGWGSEAVDIIKRVALSKLRRSDQSSPSTIINQMVQRLGTVLQRYNARMILTRLTG